MSGQLPLLRKPLSVLTQDDVPLIVLRRQALTTLWVLDPVNISLNGGHVPPLACFARVGRFLHHSHFIGGVEGVPTINIDDLSACHGQNHWGSLLRCPVAR
jgi:hypothetical protein